MSGKKKPSPLMAFKDNMADADMLVLLAGSLTAGNQRKMRKQMRERVGAALRVPIRRRNELDCLRNGDVFVTFLPGSRLGRGDLDDRRPLLRQAIVAGCAATETYLADKVMTRIGDLARATPTSTKRLREIPLDVQTWLRIEESYTLRKRGLRETVIEPYVRRAASTAPSQVGELMSLAGVSDWERRVDAARGVMKGTTREFLDRVTQRRNRIAHSGDRHGYSRGRLTVSEVHEDLEQLREIVGAWDTILR